MKNYLALIILVPSLSQAGFTKDCFDHITQKIESLNLGGRLVHDGIQEIFEQPSEAKSKFSRANNLYTEELSTLMVPCKNQVTENVESNYREKFQEKRKTASCLVATAELIEEIVSAGPSVAKYNESTRTGNNSSSEIEAVEEHFQKIGQLLNAIEKDQFCDQNYKVGKFIKVVRTGMERIFE